MINFKQLAFKVSDYSREKKFQQFTAFYKPEYNTTVIDAGASEEEYSNNANILEKRYPYPENLTVLGVDTYNEFCKRYPRVRVVVYKGDYFPFKDKVFDICWSNAVIEHIVTREGQRLFISEMMRVAKNVYFTTPNRFFPFETHTRVLFLHYLPRALFDKILSNYKTKKQWVRKLNLLSIGAIKDLLSDLKISNYKIVRNRFFGFTLSFTIMIPVPVC